MVSKFPARHIEMGLLIEVNVKTVEQCVALFCNMLMSSHV